MKQTNKKYFATFFNNQYNSRKVFHITLAKQNIVFIYFFIFYLNRCLYFIKCYETDSAFSNFSGICSFVEMAVCMCECPTKIDFISENKSSELPEVD